MIYMRFSSFRRPSVLRLPRLRTPNSAVLSSTGDFARKNRGRFGRGVRQNCE